MGKKEAKQGKQSRNLTILSWGMYDLANTAFSALFVTFFYPLFIKVFLGGTEFQLGLVMGISMLFVGLMVPLIGALSDTLKRRMPFVIIFTLLCVIFTSIVGYVSLYYALLFGLIANFCYHAALTTYDAILPDISTKKNIGTVSGVGIALGYLGTILSLFMAYMILNYFGWESMTGLKAIFPATGMFVLLFSLISFTFVKDKIRKASDDLKQSIIRSYSEVKDTLTHLASKQRSLFTFLIASFMYNDGMNTAILFLYLYARYQIQLGIREFFYVYALMALAAAIGSIMFGKIDDKIGPKRSLSISLIMWIVIIILLMNTTNIVNFVVVGSLGGLALGAVTTVNRPMLVKLSNKKNIAEFFGFLGLTEKLSGVIGPILFGFMASRFSYQSALTVLLVFFTLGFIILQKVKE